MGLSGLTAALSGLSVAQQQINVISTNVSNAQTPGYTRKILPQSAQSAGGVTIGVLSETIIRRVDIRLERDLWTLESSAAFYDVQSGYLERVEAFHGPPDVEISVAAEMGRLHDSFVALADSPESTFLQASTVDQAVDTANKINDLSNFITTLRNDAQTEIAVTVESINSLLEQITVLNEQIATQINIGRSSAATEDERSTAVLELSQLIEISSFTRGDGVLVVQTNEGAELASNFAVQLTFNDQPLSASSFYPDSAAGVFIGDPDTDPVTFDLTARNLGGKLGGLLTLRDTTFPKQMAQLDLSLIHI